MNPMNNQLQSLLQRWRDGSLTTEEMRELTLLLANPEARATLRRDWFLDTALPQALAASVVLMHRPRPSVAERLHGGIAHWFTLFAPGEARGEDSDVLALRWWARASSAALAFGLITIGWLVWPQRQETATDSEPAFIAQLMLESQLRTSP